MNYIIGTDVFVNVIKLAGVVFALLHFGVGLILFRQILLMNRKINTEHGGCLRLVSLAHILLLSGIILLIIFI
jgi:hypothetical protein